MLKSRMAAAALLALPLAGCATVAGGGARAEEIYATSSEAILKIKSGELGGIVIDLNMLDYCNLLVVQVKNLTTDTTLSKVMSPSSSEVTGPIAPGRFAAVIPAEPGRYMLTGGTCVSTSYGYDVITTRRISLASLALWMNAFDVEPGKIIYTGTPHRETVKREFGVELTFSEKLSGRKDRSSDLYTLYEIKDESERVLEQIRTFSPELVDTFVSKPTATMLDKEVVRKIVNNAYDQEAGQVAPDDAAAARNRAAAQRKVKDGLKAYVDEIFRGRPEDASPGIDQMIQTPV